MTINERFSEILKTKRISVKEPVLLILNSIDGINPDWLLRGKGEMFLDNNTPENAAPITQERLFSVIESQQRTIENLSKK